MRLIAIAALCALVAFAPQAAAEPGECSASGQPRDGITATCDLGLTQCSMEILGRTDDLARPECTPH